jgi:excisionase family DNA binding protein
MLTADVARRLEISPDRVRALARSGQLRAIRTPGGTRLYRRGDVERLRDQRRLVNRAATPIGGSQAEGL